MTPRPLYRWKSFWLGILVLGFLGWAWWISYDYQSFVNYRQMGVAQRQGYVSAGSRGRMAADGAAHEREKRGHFTHQLMPPPFFARGEWKPYLPFAKEDPVDFKAWVKWSYSLAERDFWRVFLPHWLLGTLFLVPWVSFLAWRSRRQRFLTKNNS